MAKLALPLGFIAAATLAACAGIPEPITDNPPASRPMSGPVNGQPILYSSGPVQGGTVLVPATAAFRSGTGTIENIAIVHILPMGSPAAAAPSASQGGSTTGMAGERVAYRLTVKMDDGSYQAVDQDNRNFTVGDRVTLGSDGRVIKQ